MEEKAALQGARESGKGNVLFIEGSADELCLELESVHSVVMGNAIHLIFNLDKLLQSVHRMLRSGGLFAFNSVLFVGTYVEGTELVYTEWLKVALAVLHHKNQELKRSGKPSIPRERGKSGRAFDKNWITPEQWGDKLRQNGFELVQTYKRPVKITQRGLFPVRAYSGLAELLMSGYPVETASECLQEGAVRAFKNLGIVEILRYWLEVTAIKQ